MAKEIERRFLLKDRSILAGRLGTPIVQGYLAKEDDHLTTRVRIVADSAFLSLKTPKTGFVREEFEFPIPRDEARDLLDRFCRNRIVRKTRYVADFASQRFEIDVYGGIHEGLAVVELELACEETAIIAPPWLGEEITGDSRFGNFSLALAEQACLLGGARILAFPREAA